MENVTELFHQYRDDVYRLAVSYTHNLHEAEDVCQTVFLKLLEQENLTPGKEKAWLLRVTANQCRSLLRSSWWKNTVALDEMLPAPETADQSTFLAVAALKPRYRAVVYLHYYEGYSTAEIAHILKISQSTVTTRLSRARKLLREELKED